MADTFSISIVTADGANLIAQATSSNQIVMVDALSCALAATDAADLASKTASWYDGVLGTIESSSATENVAKVVAKFGNAVVNPQAVKSVALRAKLANQADSAAVIIAAMSDENSEIVLPSSSSVAQVERVIFNFAINADEQTETVYADGATVADLDRFVSMYKAGDPTRGEAQTILGDKTFSDDVDIAGGLGVVDDAVFSSDVEINGTLAVDGTASFGGTASFAYEIALSGPTVQDGEECYFNAIQSIDGATTTDSLIIAWPDHVADETLIELQSDKVKMGGDLEAHSLYIETSAYIYQSLTVEGVATFTDPVVVAASSQIKCVDGSQKVRVQVTSYGISVKNASETEIASINTTSGIVSASGYIGAAPSIDGSNNLVIPVGGIVCAVPDSFVSSYSVGDSISISASTFKACDLSGSIKTDYITAGSYKAVSNTDSNGVTLLQRIS